MSAEPEGYLMDANGDHPEFGPQFQMIRLRTEPRENARIIALNHMRQNLAYRAVLFIRLDGQHEAWTRSDLEGYSRPTHKDQESKEA